MEKENLDYPMTDRSALPIDKYSDNQSIKSKGNYFKRTNQPTQSKAYQRILSRSRNKNSFSIQFQGTYIKTDQSFTIQPEEIKNIVRILSNLVTRRQEDCFEKIKSNLQVSTSFSFDGNGTYWSRIEDELAREEKEKNLILVKKLKLQHFLNYKKSRMFFKTLISKTAYGINRQTFLNQTKTPKYQKNKGKVLQEIGNANSKESEHHKSYSKINKKLNLVKKTLKNTKNLIDQEKKKLDKKKLKLTQRSNTEIFEKNETTRNNTSYFANYGKYYTPIAGSTPRSQAGSLWNDEILQNLQSRSRIASRIEQVVVHNVVQPIVHHIYHPLSYQNPTYNTFQVVNQTKFQPVLIPRKTFINESLNRFKPSTPTYATYSTAGSSYQPFGSIFPKTPQHSKTNYY